MADDKGKRPNDAANQNGDANADAIKDKGWAEVDLHDKPETPDTGVPSDIEPRPS